MAIEFGTPARYLPAPRDNATGDLTRNALSVPDAPAFARWLGGTWHTITWSEFADLATTLAAGLVAAGIAPGDRIALMAASGVEWVRADYAIWLAGAVSVPIPATAAPAEAEWILRDSGAVAAFTGDDRQYALIEAAGVRHIWSTAAGGVEEPAALAEVERRRRALTSGTTATIVYPPGAAHGCRLSHGNLTAAVHAAAESPFDQYTELLIGLPCTDVLARVTQLKAVHSGALTAHATDPAHLGDALLSFRPTVLLAAPEVLDRFDPGTARTAVAYGQALDAGRVPLSVRLRRGRHPKQLARFGGRLTHVVTGGPLVPRLAWFLRGIGLTVLDGYSRAETSGPVTCNLPGGTRTGTAGRPLPGCRLRITRDGEVLVRGATVFQGHWSAPTPELDGDGWFHTGDLGHLDDGYLTITGRRGVR
ncbi:AMP-binding protein [Actinophytocola algeriensis]|uniref:Long-chain acyl-CoA synthetase n=1 Tax=Actinophytocola algeriensis TaxID=1768010 RepID=A0A7W7QCP9_9PSEU|nr:AMP-binding protein [Actinophytocola algeriensis]MBB4911018.1 long-chain acyl-CoA synthetase [Actinophytocola algeriensis]MBE1474011.1 long-chain acyl-CoA synthetase [Actinophytocola algeriensis]